MLLLKLSLLAVFVFAEREHATDIEIQQVEVFEVPWQEGPPQQPQEPPQQEYGPPQQENGPPKQDYGPPKQDYGPPQQEYGPPQQEYGPPQQEYGPPHQGYAPPQQGYGPPSQEYGPPQQEYGPPPVYGPPPAEATTTESGVTTTEVPTTTELPTTTDYSFNATTGEFQRLKKEDDLSQKGVYYIYHPDGLLQRVLYSTKEDARRMEYSARLKYENVQPIQGPIYTYDPRSLEFQKIGK